MFFSPAQYFSVSFPPPFCNPSPVCDIRQAQRWWGCKNQWIEKSPVHAGLVLLLIYPLQKLLPWIWWGRIIFSPSKISCSYRKCNLGGVFEGGVFCPLARCLLRNPTQVFHSCVNSLPNSCINWWPWSCCNWLPNSCIHALPNWSSWSYWNFPIGPRWYWLLLLASGAGVATSAVPYQRARFITT